LDEPGEPELLEMLRDPDPASYNEAAKGLRKLWREQEGPFAADELDAALAHLRSRASNRNAALKAIETAAEAMQEVVSEYPDWAEPLNELATCELIRANPDESVRLALRVLEMQPAHFDCLCRLALSYAIIPGGESDLSATLEKLRAVCPGLAKPIEQVRFGLNLSSIFGCF
jgi:tetratricopeptide (TPR) repeat protein